VGGDSVGGLNSTRDQPEGQQEQEHRADPFDEKLQQCVLTDRSERALVAGRPHEFSPVFQGRDQHRDSSRVASATVEDSVVADATSGLCRAFFRALRDTAKLMATLARRVPCGHS
jgi:hypothetical protein